MPSSKGDSGEGQKKGKVKKHDEVLLVPGGKSAASVTSEAVEEFDAEEPTGAAFDYDAYKRAQETVEQRLAKLEAKSFDDLTESLAFDQHDKLRREQLGKTDYPSFYQRCLSGDLPKLELLLGHFRDGQINPSFKRELEKTNTNVLIRILKQTADKYNNLLRDRKASPELQKVMQTLLFETIKKTIKEFDTREENEIKAIKLEAFKKIAEKLDQKDPQSLKIKKMIEEYDKDGAAITSKQIEDEINWYNQINQDKPIKVEYSDSYRTKIREVKRKSLLEKNAAIAGMLKLVQEPTIEIQIKQKAQELREEREKLKQQEFIRRNDKTTKTIRTKQKDGTYKVNQVRIDFTKKYIDPINNRIKELMGEIESLERLSITEKFADYQSPDHAKVGDLMEGIYQQAYGAEGFAPQRDDMDALRQLHLLSSLEFQVGRKELKIHYDRILKNLGVTSPADIALPDGSPFYQEYMRLRNFLFEMRDYLESSYGESFLPSSQFDAYMTELANGSARKVAWRDVPGQKMSLLITGNNTPVCSLGGARRRADEGGYFARAMLINLGNFGDIKFGFNPITGQAFAIKKETTSKWADGRSGHAFEYFKRSEGYGEFQDESTREEYINEREVERRAGLLVGFVQRSRDQQEKIQKAKKKGIKDKDARIVLPHRLSPAVLENESRPRLPEQYRVNSTIQRLLPEPQDLKDYLEELSARQVAAGVETRQFQVDQCLTRLDLAVKYMQEAYAMMAEGRIIHFDIKPKNFQGVHFDFGTSKLVPHDQDYETFNHTFDFIKAGTPEYMAPELFEGADDRLKERLNLTLEIANLESLIQAKKEISSLRDIKELELKKISNSLSLDYEFLLGQFGINASDFKQERGKDPKKIIFDKIKSIDFEKNLGQKKKSLADLDKDLKEKPVSTTITANYKADIYSIGASIFGVTRAGVYLDAFFMRKGVYPDYHEDETGRRFKIIGKVDGQFVGKYYNDAGKITSERITFDPEDFIPIGKEYSEKDNDERNGFGKKGFESEGVRILDWARKVAADNPESLEAQDIVTKLEQIRDKMLAINPDTRAQLNPTDRSKLDLENGMSLLEISLRIEHYKQRLTSLKSGMSPREKILYELITKATEQVSDTKVAPATLVNDYLTKTHSRQSINQAAAGRDSAPLLALFIESLPDEYVSKFVTDLFLRMFEASLKTVFIEKNGSASALITAIKFNKPKTFKALIEKLPAGIISEILLDSKFNDQVAENQWLLHYLAKQDSMQSIMDFLEHVFNLGSEEDQKAVKLKLLQDPLSMGVQDGFVDNKTARKSACYNPVVWAIYNKNYELLNKYCELLGAKALSEYRDSHQESLFHIAAKQSDKRAYDILKKATKLTDHNLLGKEFVPGQVEQVGTAGSSAAAEVVPTDDRTAVSPLFYAFEDCPELVKDYLSDVDTVFGGKDQFLQFLLDAKNQYGISPLLLAIKGNNKVLIAALFNYIQSKYSEEQQSKLFLDLRNSAGKHALAYCANNDNVELFSSITECILKGKSSEEAKALIRDVFLTIPHSPEHSVLQHLLLDQNPAHVAGGEKMLFKIQEAMLGPFSPDGEKQFVAECLQALGDDSLMRVSTKGSLQILDVLASSPGINGQEYRKKLRVKASDTGNTVLTAVMQHPDQHAVAKVSASLVAACMKDVEIGTDGHTQAQALAKTLLLTPNAEGKSAAYQLIKHGEQALNNTIAVYNTNGIVFTPDERVLIDQISREQTRKAEPSVNWDELDESRTVREKTSVPKSQPQPVKPMSEPSAGYGHLVAPAIVSPAASELRDESESVDADDSPPVVPSVRGGAAAAGGGGDVVVGSGYYSDDYSAGSKDGSGDEKLSLIAPHGAQIASSESAEPTVTLAPDELSTSARTSPSPMSSVGEGIVDHTATLDTGSLKLQLSEVESRMRLMEEMHSEITHLMEEMHSEITHIKQMQSYAQSLNVGYLEKQKKDLSHELDKKTTKLSSVESMAMDERRKKDREIVELEAKLKDTDQQLKRLTKEHNDRTKQDLLNYELKLRADIASEEQIGRLALNRTYRDFRNASTVELIKSYSDKVAKIVEESVKQTEQLQAMRSELESVKASAAERESKKEDEIKTAKDEVVAAEARVTAAEESLQSLKVEKVAVDTANEKLRAELDNVIAKASVAEEKLRGEAAAAQAQAEAFEEQVRSIKAQLSSVVAENESAHTKLQVAENRVTELQSEKEAAIEKATTEISAAEVRVASAEAELADVTSKNEGLQRQVTAEKDRADAADSLADQLQAQKDEAERKAKEAEEKASALQRVLDQQQIQHQAGIAEKDEYLERLRSEVAEAEARAKTAEDKLVAVTSENKELKKQFSSEKDRADAADSRADQLQAELDQQQSQHQAKMLAKDEEIGETKSKTEAAEAALRLAKERLQHVTAEKEKIQSQSDAAEVRVASAEAEMVNLTAQNEELQRQSAESKDQADARAQYVDLAAREEVQRSSIQTEQAQSRFEAYGQLVEAIKGEQARVAEKNRAVSTKLQTADARVAELEKQIEQIKAETGEKASGDAAALALKETELAKAKKEKEQAETKAREDAETHRGELERIQSQLSEAQAGFLQAKKQDESVLMTTKETESRTDIKNEEQEEWFQLFSESKKDELQRFKALAGKNTPLASPVLHSPASASATIPVTVPPAAVLTAPAALGVSASKSPSAAGGGAVTTPRDRKTITAQFKSIGGEDYKVISEPDKPGIRAVVDKVSHEDPARTVALCAEIFEMARRSGSAPGHKPHVTLEAATKDPVLAATFYLIAKQFEKEGLITFQSDLEQSFIEEAMKDNNVIKNIKESFSLGDGDEIDSAKFVENFIKIQAAKHHDADKELFAKYIPSHVAEVERNRLTKLAKEHGGLFNATHGSFDDVKKLPYGSISQLVDESLGLGFESEEEQARNATSAKDAIEEMKKQFSPHHVPRLTL